MTTFKDLGLAPAILKAITGVGYDEPTPIQRDGIPHILKGEDILGLAQTGTGKTAAFGLPMVQRLSANREKLPPRIARALVLAPTRELVGQIAENLQAYVKHSAIRVRSVTGGQSINVQRNALSRGTDILVATPGRLIDLSDRRFVDLRQVEFLVLDEADQMLDLGFIHDLRKIAKMLPAERQTLLFSATMPKQIEELSQSYLKDPIRVEVAPPGKAADKITQSVHFVPQKQKSAFLTKLLQERSGDISLVFGRTKHGSERLMKSLVESGLKAVSVHGNKSQNQRERALRAFKQGDANILVATDVAARGIDIPGVTHVYNFEMPEVAENYVHRIGRTARAGADGEAVSLVGAHEVHLLRAVEDLMGISVAVASGEQPEAEKPPARKGRGGGGRPGGAGKPAGNKARRGGAKSGGPKKDARPGKSDGSGEAQSRPASKPKRHKKKPGGVPSIPEGGWNAGEKGGPSNKRRNSRPGKKSKPQSGEASR
jgi:ATP-dependent RNA helicase RhlE